MLALVLVLLYLMSRNKPHYEHTERSIDKPFKLTYILMLLFLLFMNNLQNVSKILNHLLPYSSSKSTNFINFLILSFIQKAVSLACNQFSAIYFWTIIGVRWLPLCILWKAWNQTLWDTRKQQQHYQTKYCEQTGFMNIAQNMTETIQVL